MTTNFAVLFDLDGTLADTPSLIMNTYERVLLCHGHSYNAAILRTTIGQPLVQAFAGILSTASEDDISHLCTEYRKQFSNALIRLSDDVLFPQTRPLLTRLRSQGVKVAIVTSKVSKSAHELLDFAGIRELFDGIYCHDMVAQGKPSADLVHLALKTLEIEQGNSVVVGDALDDLRMAKNAGVRGIGVTWGVSTEAEMRINGFDAVINDWSELENMLQSYLL